MKTAASLPLEALSRAFDVATMQSCMHYAFETESAVHHMLDNVARYLRKGGRFIGTIPNAAFMVYVRHIPRIPASLSSVPPLVCYTNECRDWQSRTGINTRTRATRVWEQRLSHQAWYPASASCGLLWPPVPFLSRRRGGGCARVCGLLAQFRNVRLPCPPFPSPWLHLRLISAYRLWIHSVAKQHNLRLLYKHEFHHIYLEERAHPEYGPLSSGRRARWMKISGMRLVRLFSLRFLRQGDVWNFHLTLFLHAGVYLAFAFEKI